MVYTNEWEGYGRPAQNHRGHATMSHTPGQREWARDDDGDGVREVHDNTPGGLRAARRTFLRPLRGVREHYLDQYVAMFQWGYNLKQAIPDTRRIMLPLTSDAL
ncbi:MAG TPA: hypothetical protein VGE74_28505 [Gemmata sp.]